jgi:hypothetical protein
MPRHASGNLAAVANRSEGAALSPPTASGLSWHAQPIERVLRALATTNSGLTASEAALRLDRFGANTARSRRSASPRSIGRW